MKYVFKLAALALTLGLGFSACQKDYDATPDVNKDPVQNPLSGSFTCTQAGFNFTADSKSSSLKDGVLMISGTKYDDNKTPGVYEQITLVVPNFNGNGTYGVNGSAQIIFVRTTSEGLTYTYTSDYNENYFVKVEGSYKGTFQAVVSNTSDNSDKINIEAGKFDIK